MSAIDFKLPRGAILFVDDEWAYEFRDDLGEAHHGLSLFLARRRTLEGNHPRGKVLLKAVGRPSVEEGARVKRARAKLEEQSALRRISSTRGFSASMACARRKGPGTSSPTVPADTT